jgi:hypothetical protein
MAKNIAIIYLEREGSRSVAEKSYAETLADFLKIKGGYSSEIMEARYFFRFFYTKEEMDKFQSIIFLTKELSEQGRTLKLIYPDKKIIVLSGAFDSSFEDRGIICIHKGSIESHRNLLNALNI